MQIDATEALKRLALAEDVWAMRERARVAVIAALDRASVAGRDPAPLMEAARVLGRAEMDAADEVRAAFRALKAARGEAE